MPVDTQQILDEAAKLGDLVKEHPAVARYKEARKAVEQDADANRLMADFDRQIESLSRQQASGMPVTDAQQQALESLQSKIVSHLKIKALNLAQVDFVDLLRKITQTIQRPLNLQEGAAATGGGAGPAGGGPRLSGLGRS
ncbi:MAG TPA: YlbF family regulator [Tepidisphaeraceae bacterium]|jgi:cell fate (sporulation/competence/biofilm development) regulator YlbF (YheA/YmcA/DUF963 family)|nr:YlbF family regulator [Tepidisphaeraceae bacterium]